jgi:hypothetical protein
MSEPTKPEPPRPRGRPPADEPGARLTTWVRASEYDRLCKLAQKRDQSVSALVRSLLILRLR